MKEELLANGWVYVDGEYSFVKQLSTNIYIKLVYNTKFITSYIFFCGGRFELSSAILDYDIDYDYFKNMCNQIYKDGIRSVFDKDIV